MNYIEKLKQETNKVDDMIFKDFSIGENSVTLIYIESLSSSDSINNFISSSYIRINILLCRRKRI